MSTAPHTEERSTTAGTGFALKRVKIRNYKSIANCDVELGPFTILVGRNGAGKSNFLDALRFVADSLEFSPTKAINDRDGENVYRIGDSDDVSFSIELEMACRSGKTAVYG